MNSRTSDKFSIGLYNTRICAARTVSTSTSQAWCGAPGAVRRGTYHEIPEAALRIDTYEEAHSTRTRNLILMARTDGRLHLFQQVRGLDENRESLVEVSVLPLAASAPGCKGQRGHLVRGSGSRRRMGAGSCQRAPSPRRILVHRHPLGIEH